MSNRIYIIGIGPGREEMMTGEAIAALEQADVIIYAGSLVNPELLSELLLDAVFGLPVKEDVNVNPFPGIDQQGNPACTYLGAVAAGGHQQVGVVHTIHNHEIAVGIVDGFRSHEFHGRDVSNLISPACIDILPDNLVYPDAQRFYHAGPAV